MPDAFAALAFANLPSPRFADFRTPAARRAQLFPIMFGRAQALLGIVTGITSSNALRLTDGAF